MTQLLFYLLIGTLVTGIDVLVYNILSAPPLKLRQVPAHLISTACAMLAGFTLHYALVFRPAEPLFPERVARYILTVCASAYLLQTFVIFPLSSLWLEPARCVRTLAERSGALAVITTDALERNFVKGCAIGTGLAFNFISFKFFVYADW